MRVRLLLGWLLLGSVAWAALGLGSTREEIVAHYGPPRGTSKAGQREILTYPDGRVVLENGRAMFFELKLPSADATPPAATKDAASSAPPASAPAPSSTPVATADPWVVDFEAAKKMAAAQNKRLLVLFTGTDWCPPCQSFQSEVAYNADFLKIFSTSFVFVKVDWLRNRPQPPAEAARVNALRREYGVASYPTLMVLAADGTQLMRVDTRKGREAESLADFYIQAVDEARQATRDGKPVKSSWWPF